ncbi:nitroreductase family deazaflavin-dependent oxidoreductase [Promicromonospora soli]
MPVENTGTGPIPGDKRATSPGGNGPTGGALAFARLSNPATRALAGHRLFPLWAVLHHRGRKTGRALSVPVAVVAAPDAFVIALPWGPGTNWVRNVLAADGARLRWKGRDHQVTDPRVVGADEARPYFPPALWPVAQRVIGAEHFLLVRRSSARRL